MAAKGDVMDVGGQLNFGLGVAAGVGNVRQPLDKVGGSEMTGNETAVHVCLKEGQIQITPCQVNKRIQRLRRCI